MLHYIAKTALYLGEGDLGLTTLQENLFVLKSMSWHFLKISK